MSLGRLGERPHLSEVPVHVRHIGLLAFVSSASIAAPARACINEVVGSPSMGGSSLFALATVGAIVHALLLGVMPTRRRRLVGLMVTLTGVIGIDLVFGVSRDALAFVLVLIGYAGLASFHAAHTVRPLRFGGPSRSEADGTATATERDRARR